MPIQQGPGLETGALFCQQPMKVPTVKFISLLEQLHLLPARHHPLHFLQHRRK